MVEKVEKISTEEFKKHFENLINCLINIAPSRNRVTQMLFLLPKYEEELKEVYEFFLDEKLLDALNKLGLEYGEKVNIRSGTFFKYLFEFIQEKMFTLFHYNSIREQIKKVLNKSVPDLKEEWFRQKLEICLSEPNLGNYAKRFLQIMKEKNWSTSLEEIKRELKDKTEIVRDVLKEFGIIDYWEFNGNVSLSWEAKEFRNILEEKLEK